MKKKNLIEMNNEELAVIEGGLIPELSSIAYLADVYGYYRETKYVASYNDNVVAAGHYDMVKESPSMPEYNVFYIFTR